MSFRQEIRKAKATQRLRHREQRTPQEQLKLLDLRLGKGLGAKKERARLSSLIEETASE